MRSTDEGGDVNGEKSGYWDRKINQFLKFTWNELEIQQLDGVNHVHYGNLSLTRTMQRMLH